MVTIEHKYYCHGVIIPLLGRRQLELWFCPPGSYVPKHIHPDIDSFIVHIWGKVTVYKEQKQRELPIFSLFKSFKIPALISHGFTSYNNWFVFLNIEKWRPGISKTTAAQNIIELKTYGSIT